MMSDDEIIWASAAEQARRVRDGELSARELTTAVLERIDAVDERLNAYVAVDGEGAIRAAHIADQRQMSGAELGPLHGVPFSVKDLLDTAGLTTTYGSRLHVDNVPDVDAPVVRRMREHGAILVGKVHSPEFGLGAETVTSINGRTSNPWDVTRTPGGSSGGSAAAVAAGMGSVSLGSDAGGSIRLPAAWCGVFGLKPTYGRVPVNPKQARADHPTETVGPIARHIEDIALLLDVTAGHDPLDPSSLPVAVPSCRAAIQDLEGPLRVRFGLDLGMGVTDPDIEAEIVKALDDLGKSGAIVEESKLDVGEPHPFLVMYDLIAGSCAARYAHAYDDFELLMGYSQAFLDVGRSLTAADYVRAAYEAKRLRAAVDQELADCDVLAFPVTAVSAWRHGEPPETVAGMPVAERGGITYGGLPFLALANVTGHPAISVPCGLDREGLPVAVQLVGKHFDEPTLLCAAARLAAAHPFNARPHVG